MSKYDRYAQADDTTLEQWLDDRHEFLQHGACVYSEYHSHVAFVFLADVVSLVDDDLFDYFDTKIKHKKLVNGLWAIDFNWMLQRIQTLRTNDLALEVFNQLRNKVVDYTSPESHDRRHNAYQAWGIANGAIQNILRELKLNYNNQDRLCDLLSYNIQQVIKHWDVQLEIMGD